MGIFSRIVASTGWDSGSRMRNALAKLDANFQLIEPKLTDSGAADYVPVLTDRLIGRSRATAQTLSVPTNAAVPFPIGTTLVVLQTGAGALTLVAPAGGAINRLGAKTLVSSGANAAIVLRKIATNTWIASGELA